LYLARHHMVLTRVYKPPQFFCAFPMHKKWSNSKLCWSTMIIARVAASRDDSSNVHPPRLARRLHRSRKNPKPTPSQPPPTRNQVPQYSPPCTIAVDSAPKSIPGTEPSSRRGADRRWAARRNEGNDPDRPLPTRPRQYPMQTIHAESPSGFKQFEIIKFLWTVSQWNPLSYW